jgi:hypothetical protein
MTKKELENLVAELRAELAASKQPSTIRQFWTWCKPYLVPFILGAMLGSIVTYSAVCGLPSADTQTSLEQKAALGGAVIPFPSGNPLPSPLASPPKDSKAESTASLWTTLSEPPLPSNPQADNGQTTSTRFYRLLTRRMQ